MLMVNLKKSMKKVLWATLILIIPSFIVWNIGTRGRGRNSDTVAKVNRHSISANEYALVLNRYYEYYKEIYKDEFNEDVAKKLKFREKALDNLIEHLLLRDEAKRKHIKVAAALDIEKKVRQNALFRDEKGEFDPEKYDFLLKAGKPGVWKYLRTWAKNEVIKEEVISRIKDSFKVTEHELYDEFVREKELVRTEYVSFQSSQYASEIKPSDDEIKAFFEENKNDFAKPESANVEYLTIKNEDLKKEIQVTDDEIKKYYEENEAEFKRPEEIHCRHILMRAAPDASPEKVQGIYKQFEFMMGKYKEEVTFETLARVYSEDYNTRQEGGDLGYISRGTMPPEFDEAAFSMKAGEVSKVIKTSQGYHIIKLEDRRPPHEETLDEAKDTIKEKLLNQKAEAEAEEKAKKIYDEVYDAETLKKASEKYNIALQESGFFSMGEEIKGVGRNYKASKSAFEMGEDAVSELIETPEGYAIFRLKEKRPAYIPELNDIKKEAEEKIKAQKAKAVAKENSEECLKKLKAGGDFKEIAKQFKAEIRTPEPFNRDGYLKKVDYSKEFGEICFALKKGEYGRVVETQQGFYIFKLIEKIPPDKTEFAKIKGDLKKRLLREKEYYLYEEWYENLKKEAKIKTYL